MGGRRPHGGTGNPRDKRHQGPAGRGPGEQHEQRQRQRRLDPGSTGLYPGSDRAARRGPGAHERPEAAAPGHGVQQDLALEEGSRGAREQHPGGPSQPAESHRR